MPCMKVLALTPPSDGDYAFMTDDGDICLSVISLRNTIVLPDHSRFYQFLNFLFINFF